MMTQLPFAPLHNDAEVIGFVREHLRRNDRRFEGNSRAAIRRRRRAERAAQGVLEWWQAEGQAYGSSDMAKSQAAAEAYVVKSVGGVLLSILGAIALQWVERLVIRLLTEWLNGMAGASYRSTMQRRR